MKKQEHYITKRTKQTKKRIEIKQNSKMSVRNKLRASTKPLKKSFPVDSKSRNKLRRGIQLPVENYIKNKKINVVISAYDCVDFIEECLISVNIQTYKPTRILLGIDGCNKTLKKVKEIQNKFSNLDVYYAKKNQGPYKMFNSLISLINDDEYIQIFGADDVMDEDMLENMMKSDSPAVSRNDGILFIKKEIFNKVGGFRSWRCAADSEIISRLKLAKINVVRLPKYFFLRLHDKQLTRAVSTNLNSNLRKKYINIIINNNKSINPKIVIKQQKNKIKKIVIKQQKNKIKKIDSKQYWINRYNIWQGNSGVGSYGIYAEYKAKIINNFIEENNITTVCELGSGDGYQLSLYKQKKYYGYDISSLMVENNKKRFSATNYFFSTNINDFNSIKYDLTYSADVILHLIEDEVYIEYMLLLFGLSNNYVIIYSSDEDKNFNNHCKFRKFTKDIPKNFKLINKIINPLKGKDTQSDFFIYKNENYENN